MRTVDFSLLVRYSILMYTPNTNIKSRIYRPAQMSGILDEVVESALPYYKRAAERNRAKLQEIGKTVGSKVVSIAYAKLNMPPPEGVKVSKPKPLDPPWLKDLIDPIIDPVLDGFKAEIEPKLIRPISRKIVGIVVMAAIGGAVVGYFVGRRR
jgi:hypothetical protein